MGSSVEFSWNPQEFKALLESCRFDDSVNLTLRYLSNRDARILEAGCGSGRVVKYLADLGYRNVCGIELNESAVQHINAMFPELQVLQGDILDMHYPLESFDVVLSYGVVEHFPAGVVLPLRKLFEVLKPGGTAIVTVPCLNGIRRWMAMSHLDILQPRALLRGVRSLFTPRREKREYLYHVWPRFGEFFEYWLTPAEFEEASREAGFEIVESLPIAHLDGLYHIFGPPLISFREWRFQISRLGEMVNRLLMRHPFLHNHMHACVLRKPAKG